MEEKKKLFKSSFTKDLKKFGFEFDINDPKCVILGEGSFGIVGLYKNQNNKYKAIKIINIAEYIEKYNDYDIIKREQEIIHIINNLISKKICPKGKKYIVQYKIVYSKKKKWGFSNFIYFISDYYGIDLRNYCNNNKINIQFIKNIGKQIIEGLTCLMDMGVVLYDLKPENILINKKKKIKLIDYGGSGYSCNENIVSECRFKNSIKITCKNKITKNKNKKKYYTCKKTPFIYTGNYVDPNEMNNNKTPFNVDLWSLGIIFLELNEIIHNNQNFETERKNLLTKKSWKKNGIPTQKKIYEYLDKINIENQLKEIIQKLLIIDNKKRISVENLLKCGFFLTKNKNKKKIKKNKTFKK